MQAAKMVIKTETPIARDKSGNKKKKNRKNKTETESPELKKQNVIAFDENAQQPTAEHVSNFQISII